MLDKILIVSAAIGCGCFALQGAIGTALALHRMGLF